MIQHRHLTCCCCVCALCQTLNSLPTAFMTHSLLINCLCVPALCVTVLLSSATYVPPAAYTSHTHITHISHHTQPTCSHITHVTHTQVTEVINELYGMRVVGWYHSHPSFPALPSVIDIANQLQVTVGVAGWLSLFSGGLMGRVRRGGGEGREGVSPVMGCLACVGVCLEGEGGGRLHQQLRTSISRTRWGGGGFKPDISACSRPVQRPRASPHIVPLTVLFSYRTVPYRTADAAAVQNRRGRRGH